MLIAALALVAIVAVMVSRRADPERIRAAAGDAATEVVSSADLPVLDLGPAPAVSAAAGWLNSTPLTASDLAGRVVLYDFWTFGCSNCRHTLPHVQAWQERYATDGLVILSIHTPEFEYEADPLAVQQFLDDEGLTYAVALDPVRDVWHAWDNHYWPAFYLYDVDGRLRLRHYGEGAYETTEDAIRVLLGVDPESPRAVVP